MRLAGGIPKLVRLAPPRWELPRAELAAAFSAKTKAIVLNSPMNPIGKVFTADELSFIADLVKRHDAYAVCDEVYEHLTFDDHKHVPLMTLPGMGERCLRIGSAGKTFSLTGWKVGYVTAAPALLQNAAKAHQFLTFTTPPNLQRAVAYGLSKDDGYFQTLADELQQKRDVLTAGLRKASFDVPQQPQGTYFVSADFTPLGFQGDDAAFCRFLTTEVGVAAIPISAFFEGGGPKNYVRFAFCKQGDVLAEALTRLAKLGTG